MLFYTGETILLLMTLKKSSSLFIFEREFKIKGSYDFSFLFILNLKSNAGDSFTCHRCSYIFLLKREKGKKDLETGVAFSMLFRLKGFENKNLILP